jgi:hypothetical protein
MAPDAAASPQSLIDLGQAPAEVRIGGRLARRLGSRRVSMAQVMAAAAQETDPRVRRDAMRVGMKVIERDPAMLGAMFGQLTGVDDYTIASNLRGMAGDDAEELMKNAAAGLRSRELRDRAQNILRALQRTGAASPRNES